MKRFRLCRGGCCPEVEVDPRPDARWPVTITERGDAGRPAATLRLTRNEAGELVRVLRTEGYGSSTLEGREPA